MTTNQTIDGVPRELLKRLVRIEAIERDDPNGSGYDLCPECFGQGKWNWSAGKRVSVDPIEHSEGCAIEELRALLDAPAPVSDGVNWKAVANEQMGIIQALKAAQPQGEPVAELQVAFFEHGPMATINWFTPSAFEPGATKLYAEQPAPVTTGYVQAVPDQCDRITWRGSYYHLPLEQPAPVDQGEWEKLARLAAYYLSPAIVSHQWNMTDETRKEALGVCHAINNGKPAPVAVAYQYRQRPLWRKDDNSGWMPWQDCSQEAHADYTASPDLHDWQYETRTLYAGPNQQYPLPLQSQPL